MVNEISQWIFSPPERDGMRKSSVKREIIMIFIKSVNFHFKRRQKIITRLPGNFPQISRGFAQVKKNGGPRTLPPSRELQDSQKRQKEMRVSEQIILYGHVLGFHIIFFARTMVLM